MAHVAAEMSCGGGGEGRHCEPGQRRSKPVVSSRGHDEHQRCIFIHMCMFVHALERLQLWRTGCQTCPSEQPMHPPHPHTHLPGDFSFAGAWPLLSEPLRAAVRWQKA